MDRRRTVDVYLGVQPPATRVPNLGHRERLRVTRTNSRVGGGGTGDRCRLAAVHTAVANAACIVVMC